MKEFRRKLLAVGESLNTLGRALEAFDRALEELQGERQTSNVDQRIQILEQSLRGLHNDFVGLLHRVKETTSKSDGNGDEEEKGSPVLPQI